MEDEEVVTVIKKEVNTKSATPPLPPTLSHSDMARPPHEDPEYQRKIVGNIRQGLLMSSGTAGTGPIINLKPGPITLGSNTAIHNYAWTPPAAVSFQN